MKNKLKRIGYLLLVPLVVFTMLFFPVQESEAASLKNAYLVLNRMKVGLGASDNIDMYVAFATTGAVATGGTLKIEFPGGTGESGRWCATAGTLTTTGVSSTPADQSAAPYRVSSALPGTLAGTCAEGTGTQGDTITITGLTALTASTTYGVRLTSAGAGKLGTPTTGGTKIVSLTVTSGSTIETIAFGINIVTEDQVQVTATVMDVQTVTCTIATGTVNLGQLYKGGIGSTGTTAIGTTTSGSAGGYYWLVYGKGDGTNAGLYKSTAATYLIKSDNTNLTVDISTTGSEGFGLNVAPTDGAVGGPGFSGNASEVYGSIGANANNAELLLYKIGAQANTANTTVTYGARAGGSSIAGSYSETVTYVCGGYY